MESEARLAPGEAGPTGTWWIGLDSWILQDGNYTDFVTGELRQFALEFGYARTKRLHDSSDAPQRRCKYSGHGATYEVSGQLLRSASEPMKDAFVLDFGLNAYSEWMVLDDLEPPGTGDWLAGEVYLGVDPFEYMDRLARRPEMPPLIYTWTIEEIQLDATPPMQVEYGHPLYNGPDEGTSPVPNPVMESWRTVSQTRMWDHDGRYRLRCTLESSEPAASMAKTGPRSPYGPLTGP